MKELTDPMRFGVVGRMPDASLVWRGTPSPNRAAVCRVPGDVRGIVLHATEGSLPGVMQTFAQPNGVSAHYVIDRDGTVVAVVPEGDVAYHVAAFGNNARLNGMRPDWLPTYNGRYSAVNACTVGIELVGFSATGFSDAQYRSLGPLALGIAFRWGFPLDTSRVVTHASLQTDRRDPGEHFDWGSFRASIAQAMSALSLNQDTDDAVSGLQPGDREIIDTVRALGADAAGVRAWIERLGAYESQ